MLLASSFLNTKNAANLLPKANHQIASVKPPVIQREKKLRRKMQLKGYKLEMNLTKLLTQKTNSYPSSMPSENSFTISEFTPKQKKSSSYPLN